MKLQPTAAQLAQAIPLPSVARTQSGVEFYPEENLWLFRDGLRLLRFDFQSWPSLPEAVLRSIKGVLVWRIEHTSPLGALSLFRELKQTLLALVASRAEPLGPALTHADLLSMLTQQASNPRGLSAVLAGLRRAQELGYPLLTVEAVRVLNDVSVKNVADQVPVMTLDPVLGPFSSLELEGICAELNAAYADGRIPQDLWVLSWLYLALGPRPVQLAALKICDFEKTTSPEGLVEYHLDVPRAKQRGAAGNPRAEFKRRPLIPRIGQAVENWVAKVAAQFEGKLSDVRQAPLFPQPTPVDMPVGFEFHQTVTNLNARFNNVWDKLNVMSERTGERLNITAIRFRRTLGTRAAQDGKSLHTIAELLDHNTLDSAKAYIANVPEIVQRIDRAVAEELAPLAQAFVGRLIEGEEQATRGQDPKSRIIDLRVDQSRPVGSCGQHSFCSFSAPLACYTCTSFEPWLDGPHELLLDRLLERREQMCKTSSPRIATIHDRTILAVTQVVKLCQEQRSKEGDSGC